MSNVRAFLPTLQAAYNAIHVHLATAKIGDALEWMEKYDRLVEEYNQAAEQACQAIWEDTKEINSLSTIRQVYLQKRDGLVVLTPYTMEKFIFASEKA